MRHSKPLIVIPARLASTRLPRKVLAEIGGEPMIVHVWRRACEAGLGQVVVACAEVEIAEAVARVGGAAVLTDPDLPSGSDRICQAVRRLDPERHFDIVLNVQGDVPTIPPAQIRAVHALLEDPAVDIATLAGRIARPEEASNPNVVKAVVELAPDATMGRALYFTRAAAPHGSGDMLHHIGIYGYRRAALERFVALPPSALERREKLEQLRALADGMRFQVGIVDEVFPGVDTQEDLDLIRSQLGHPVRGAGRFWEGE